MAILRKDEGYGSDCLEVRIKKLPDQTYFEEFEGSPEKPEAQRSDRYIPVESGAKWNVEFILRKRFQFGAYHCVHARLRVPGMDGNLATVNVDKPEKYRKELKEDLIREINHFNAIKGGKTMLGVELMFRDVKNDTAVKPHCCCWLMMCSDPSHDFFVEVQKTKFNRKSAGAGETVDKEKTHLTLDEDARIKVLIARENARNKAQSVSVAQEINSKVPPTSSRPNLYKTAQPNTI